MVIDEHARTFWVSSNGVCEVDVNVNKSQEARLVSYTTFQYSLSFWSVC